MLARGPTEEARAHIMAAAAGGAQVRRGPADGFLVLVAGRRGAATIPMPESGTSLGSLQRDIADLTGIRPFNVEIFATNEANEPVGDALRPEDPFNADVFQRRVIVARDASAAGEFLALL